MHKVEAADFVDLKRDESPKKQSELVSLSETDKPMHPGFYMS